MRPFLSATLFTATLALAALAAPAMAQEMPQRTITVSGQGEVKATPDKATVSIGVQTTAQTAAEAMDMASAATSAILARLDSEQIPPEDISSGAIRLSPQYSRSVLGSGNEISGYRADNLVEVDVTDLDRLGGLLAALVGDGANRLDGVRFGLQDPAAAMDEARRRAVAEGARLAELYAQAAGVERGALQVISDQGGGGYSPLRAAPMMLEAASSPQYDVPIAPGEITLSASVQMVYAIAD